MKVRRERKREGKKGLLSFFTGAPWELKASYAFRIFDFDSDAYIGPSDIERTLHCITGNIN